MISGRFHGPGHDIHTPLVLTPLSARPDFLSLPILRGRPRVELPPREPEQDPAARVRRQRLRQQLRRGVRQAQLEQVGMKYT